MAHITYIVTSSVGKTETEGTRPTEPQTNCSTDSYSVLSAAGENEQKGN